MNKMLVVYYSVSNGNTREIAHRVAEYMEADLAEIRTVQPYEGTYQEIVAQGKREVERGYHPPILPLPLRVLAPRARVPPLISPASSLHHLVAWGLSALRLML